MWCSLENKVPPCFCNNNITFFRTASPSEKCTTYWQIPFEMVNDLPQSCLILTSDEHLQSLYFSKSPMLIRLYPLAIAYHSCWKPKVV